MSDIAQRANVSRPTVSIVLNERHEAIGIAPETRERVLQAARDLGYRRNALARAVKTGRSMTLGFLAGDADIEYSSRAFSGVLDEADEQNYTVKRFRLFDRPEDKAIIERCSEHRLDGIIVNDTGQAITTNLMRQEFEGQSVPVVWVDPKGPQSWGVQVRPDEAAGVELAVRHLVELGHRRIAFVGGIPNVGTGATRFDCFQKSMGAAGLDASMVRWTYWKDEVCIEVAHDLLALPKPPTAFLCGSDATALIFLKTLRSKGYEVPRDASVIGFGDLARVEYADPALTTIHVPYAEMGRAAVRQVLDMVARQEPSFAHSEALLPTHLKLRESTGPAPSR